MIASGLSLSLNKFKIKTYLNDIFKEIKISKFIDFIILLPVGLLYLRDLRFTCD